jgi:hypothetical protein
VASRYDMRMAEIAEQRAMARGELDRIEESTATINAGMADPLNWILCAGALVGIPFTGGLSVGLAVIAILRATKGGKANIQAMQPTMADVASPGLGCVRILGALGVLVILFVLVLLFGVILYANATGVNLK